MPSDNESNGESFCDKIAFVENQPPKKTKSPWILGIFVFVSFTLLVVLQSSNLWKTFSVDSASDTIILYALSSLNFIAFIIFGFILLRTLFKLARERRALVPGSKIKTRLWAYFFAVSILPIIAMAVFSYLFMNRALERWFQRIPENVISQSRAVQSQAIEAQSAKLHDTAKMLAAATENRFLTDQDLQKIARSGNLTHIEIISKNGIQQAVYEKSISDEQQKELAETLFYARNDRTNEPILSDGIGFDAATVELPDGGKLIVVPDIYAGGNVSRLIDKSLDELEKLKQKELNIRQIGLLTLGVLTFLLIFASSWAAIYIARGLTVPIMALAQGADVIAQGNFAHRIDVLAEDELGLLVNSFNQMSATLEANSAELLERRRYIETILQSLATGVISFDAGQRVTTINRSAMQMLRLEDGDFTNFELAKLVGEENYAVLERLLCRAVRIGQAGEQTVLQRENADGSRDNNQNLSVALTATALPKIDDQPNGVVLVIEDLSELITAQRASAWAEVARRMAHEIKNPLTPIQLSAERIAKRFQVQSPKSKVQSILSAFKPKNIESESEIEERNRKLIKDGTETILREVNSLKSMVDEFSRFARLPNVRLEAGNLNDILAKAAALYEDREVKINLNTAENLPAAMIDEEQLKRVFINLIENAVESFDETQTDKIIAVKTFHDAARDLIVAEITDNGSGITPADFQKLFQPYFSTKGRGTGLGLAIVQRIVTEHHGKIKAVNNSPKGAKFIVELPVIV